MDPRHKDILLKSRSMIVKDLDIENVIDPLLSSFIVSTSLRDEIQREPNRESQNRKLLDILPRRGPKAYSVFKEALRRNYDWMSNEMDTLEATEDCVDSLVAPLGPNTPHSHLPANPPLSVKRERKMEKLRKGLTELQPGNYLVLHALRGYGKSTLASATLRDKTLVAKLFKNEFYWVKFGQGESISETILIQLNMLFHRVRNLDYLSEPTSEDSLKYSLKRHFSEHDQALLILDDVNSSEIIDAFDFGCKTLVLTTDVDILKERTIDVIEMSDGFSANESLDLFAKATGIPVSDLPRQARQIHDECKGMPLMISMFSAQFKEIKQSLANGKTSDKIWSYYLNALRETESNVFKKSLERRAATFDLCIEKLSPEDKRLYKTLAIFPEDVNIPTKTLSIFWGIDVAEVDLRMLTFCQKSLACREWHRCLHTYVYAVHNLVLAHLRQTLSAADLKSLHKSYVEKNFEYCDSDFSKLPTDNYVHSYIGYHMEKGGLKDRFSDLYLNFGFIESKVFHIGPGDLLIDLKKYRKYITQDSADRLERVEDLEKFLIQQASTLAEYRRRKCLDLVQVALKHPFSSFVRNTAESLALERKSSLYLNHLKHNAENLDSYSEELHLQVRSVAFTKEANVILFGNDKGKVVLWNCSNRQHVAFYGNNCDHPITKIVAPEEEKFFISISGDGRAKLFEMQGDFDSQKNSHIKTLHPRAKQKNWINMSESKSGRDDSRITFSINNQKILDLVVSNKERKIAACTDAGDVAIWDYDGRLLVRSQVDPNAILTSIAFSLCSTLLHTVNVSTGALIMLDTSNAQYKTQFSLQPEKDKIISLLSVPQYSNLLLVLLETKLYRVRWIIGGDPLRGPQTKEFARLRDKAVAYSCAAVTKDGKYVVTADTGGSVNICDLHEGSNVLRTFKNWVLSLDTYWLEDKSCHMICGGNRDTLVPMLHSWKFDPKEKPIVQRLPLFDATMEPGERNVTAVATSNGTVQIIQNDDVIAETPAVAEKITSLLIFENGNHVLYATENGAVFLFDIKLNHSKLIMELSKSVSFMTILKIDNEDVIICEEGGQNLQIWINPENTQLVENSGSVIFCDLIKSVKRILTVAEKVLKIWDPNTWRLQSKYEAKAVPKISCCSISQNQNYLALAGAEGNLNILKIMPKDNPRSIKFQESMEQKFNEGITACSFSLDEQLLALGTKSGEISIIGVQSKSVIRKLELHRRPVKELRWGPLDIDDPILVSLANELAWWKVETKSEREKIPHRETSQSLSELRIDPASIIARNLGKMRSSKSLELGSMQIMGKVSDIDNDDVFSSEDSLGGSFSDSGSNINLNQNSNGFNAVDRSKISLFWSGKKPKYLKIPGLLSVVKLDGDIPMKVCISKDFCNFLTLNGHGAIYNLRILETKNADNNNGDT